MRNALKIRLEGPLTQQLRFALSEIPVIELVSAKSMAWLSGAAAADVIFIDYRLWLATNDEVRAVMREKDPSLVVILVSRVEDEEATLGQLGVDADDYLLPTASAEEIARSIRNSRQRRSLLMMLRDTQEKLSQSHQRLTQLLDDGATYRIGTELARESELVRNPIEHSLTSGPSSPASKSVKA
jgi:DNA-binding NarL/FixJ family response regulator